MVVKRSPSEERVAIENGLSTADIATRLLFTRCQSFVPLHLTVYVFFRGVNVTVSFF